MKATTEGFLGSFDVFGAPARACSLNSMKATTEGFLGSFDVFGTPARVCSLNSSREAGSVTSSIELVLDSGCGPETTIEFELLGIDSLDFINWVDEFLMDKDISKLEYKTLRLTNILETFSVTLTDGKRVEFLA